MNYQEQTRILAEIYEKYRESIAEEADVITRRKYQLAELDSELDQVKTVSLTEISFLQKKLTDLNLSIADSEDINEITSKLQEELAEAEFLLSDELERAEKVTSSYEAEIEQKTAELNAMKEQYQDRIERLLQQIQERELLVGELSVGHLSNRSESLNPE